jgi:hypothetical protein
MIRLNDSEWGRIRHHSPEENISEGRAGRKPVPTRQILEAAWVPNGTCCRKLSELQNAASQISGLVPQRGSAPGSDGHRRQVRQYCGDQ